MAFRRARPLLGTWRADGEIEHVQVGVRSGPTMNGSGALRFRREGRNEPLLPRSPQPSETMTSTCPGRLPERGRTECRVLSGRPIERVEWAGRDRGGAPCRPRCKWVDPRPTRIGDGSWRSWLSLKSRPPEKPIDTRHASATIFCMSGPLPLLPRAAVGDAEGQ